jgi:hypothetical protein
MDLVLTHARHPTHAPVAKTNATRCNAHAAPPVISRRKFLALAVVSVEAAKDDASLCFATLDTVDFIDDALESHGPLETHEASIPKRL